MIIFDYEPNWSTEPKIEYGFLTVISTSRTMKEQRKSLHSVMRRTIAYTIDVDTDAGRILNSLQLGDAIPHYVPVVTEALLPIGTGNLNGSSNIVVNDFSSYFNLRTLTSKVMLINLDGSEVSEIATISSLESPVIYLAANIAGTFPIATTVVYPVMYGICTNKKFSDITDRVVSIGVEFMEYF